jgi:Leucine-rich repeat (LRR) protein
MHANTWKLSLSSCTAEEIYLYQNDFVGSIPLGLYACQHLEIISLSVNSFVSFVPTWLAQLPHLTILSLGDNPLVGSVPSCSQQSHSLGSIPTEIGLIQKLSVNSLTGSIPYLENLSNLYFLDLQANPRSSGTWKPPSIAMP